MVEMLQVFYVERNPGFLLVFDKVGEIIKEAIAVECCATVCIVVKRRYN